MTYIKVNLYVFLYFLFRNTHTLHTLGKTMFKFLKEKVFNFKLGNFEKLLGKSFDCNEFLSFFVYPKPK